MIRTARILHAILRVDLAIVIEYRAQVFLWMLAGITPLIMMFVWMELAKDGAIEQRNPQDFARYFLLAFVAGQVTQAWAVWNFDYLIRSGTFAINLLRPFDPWWSEVVENLASNGFRLPLTCAVAAVGLWLAGALDGVDWTRLPLFAVSLVLAWQVAFNLNYVLALMGLWTERVKSLDTWNWTLIAVLGGSVFPLDLLPPVLASAIAWTPYPSIINFPVAVMTGADPLPGLFIQAAWIAVFVLAHRILWRAGLKRFGAVGG